MAREGEHFYREEKELGRAVVNKESMAFHWLSPSREEEESSCGALLSSQGERAPPAGLPTVFN